MERMPNIVQEWLNKHINCTDVLKAQKAQAMKQARHRQAACQQERAKHMKLLEKYEKLMEENNDYKVIQEKLGAWMSEGQAQFTKEIDGTLFAQEVQNSMKVMML